MLRHKAVVAVLMLVVFVFSQGCSLIGLGLGAAVPRYSEPVDPTSLPEGTRVSVDGDDGFERSGDLVSTKGDAVTISNGDARTTSRATTVRERKGSYWATGFGVGLALDLTVVLVTLIGGAIAFSHSQGLFGNMNGLGHF